MNLRYLYISWMYSYEIFLLRMHSIKISDLKGQRCFTAILMFFTVHSFSVLHRHMLGYKSSSYAKLQQRQMFLKCCFKIIKYFRLFSKALLSLKCDKFR